MGTRIRVSYYDLLHGTDGFDESNLLGFGYYGSVYKATLPNGMIVAVKVFCSNLDEALLSFDIECVVACNLRHRNLVKIITSCSNGYFKCLIMEFMSNGNLDRWLYSHNNCLDILKRLNILIDVAVALEYLHYGSSTPVVHCDLKPSNVLLDENMVAHLTDFGVAKLVGEEHLKIYTKTLATIGYMAPEYGSEGAISIKGDVYSYGYNGLYPVNLVGIKAKDDLRWVCPWNKGLIECLVKRIIIDWIPRHCNLVADWFAHVALREKCLKNQVLQPPSPLPKILVDDAHMVGNLVT
ncbi:probable LRR receptor-like serine/threonine-protein kinase At3g47570 [Neltuma alba]|uniref:probable LRR receptor-like serine/threonine-protein kinase At3g47570 n=1 Tax=Neltuma alba TaxID=207710 RepID=UPI0010A3FC89|nr:probable LRR receptor-like serine/threonine-protein kinase At3g47570 [Prosopis alba]